MNFFVTIILNLFIFICINLLISFLTNKKSYSKKKIIIYSLSFIISTIISIYLIKENNNIYLSLILSNITLNTLSYIIVNKYKLPTTIKIKNIILYIIIAISIASTLELTLFNYRHFESLSFENINADISIDNNNNIKYYKEYNAYYVFNNNNCSFKITNIDKQIKNIYVKIERLNPPDYPEYAQNSNYLKKTLYSTNNISLSVQKTDEFLPSFTEHQEIEASFYQRLYLNDDIDNMKLNIQLNKGNTYKIDIILNSKVPYRLEIMRILFITFIIFLFFIFRPKSEIYKIKAIDKKRNKPIITTVLIINFIILYGIVNINPYFYEVIDPHREQYNRLAESFAAGHLNLDIYVPEVLANLENPYDPNELAAAKLKKDVDYAWDTAFYKGKYYSYFGVVPVLTAYLPHYLITHESLRNNKVIFVMGGLIVLSVMYLVYSIVKRWYKNTNIGIFILAYLLFLYASGYVYILEFPDFYEVPISYGLFFATLGLGLWISSYKKEKSRLSLPKITIGSFCLALTAGCRPQFVLVSFLIFPLFFKYFFKEKFSKRKLLELFLILVPYIIVAVPLMIYNYLRFDSPFEFGAQYHMTLDNMTTKRIEFGRIYEAIYYYLFNPVRINASFPYLESASKSYTTQTTYYGKQIIEYVSGGFLSTNLICILSLLTKKFKNGFKDKIPYLIALISPLIAIFIIILDTGMSGILQRYFADFAWLFLLSTIIIIFTLNEKYNSNKRFKKIIIFLVFLSISYNIILILESTYWYSLSYKNIYIYEKIRYLINFLH